MPKLILESDWSDYDDKKKKKGDSNFFSCEEEWEVRYLVNKIHQEYPFYTQITKTKSSNQ